MDEEEIDPELSKAERDAVAEVMQASQENVINFNQSRPPLPEEQQGAPVPQDFAAPLDTLEGQVARGFVDPDGNVTKLGENYLYLQESGSFDESGNLTLKGKALITPKEQINDTAKWLDNGYTISDEDVQLFAERKKLKIDEGEKEDKPFLEDIKDLGEGIFGIGKALNTALGKPFDSMENAIAKDKAVLDGTIDQFNDKKSKEANVIRAKIVEGAISAPVTTLVGASTLVSNNATYPLLEKLGVMTPEEAQKAKDKQSYKYELTKQLYKETDAEALAGIVGLQEEYANAAEATQQEYFTKFGEEKGSEEFQKALNSGVALGGVVTDPINLLPFNIVGKVFKIPRIAAQAINTKKAVAALNVGQEALQSKALIQTGLGKLAEEVASTSKILDDTIKIGGNVDEITALTAKLDDLTSQQKALSTAASQADEVIEASSIAANKAEISMETMATAASVGRKVLGDGAELIAKSLDKTGNSAAKANRTFRKIESLVGRYPLLRGATMFSAGAGLVADTSGVSSAVAGTYLTGRLALILGSKILKKTAGFTRVISEEVVQRTNSVPFWQRVATNQRAGTITGAAASVMNLSSPIINGVTRIAKGTAAALPEATLYSAVNSGGFDGDTFQTGLRDALVFGGGTRIVGGKLDHAQLQQNEFANFTEKLKKVDPSGFETYSSIKDRSTRHLVSSIDATYPNMFDWEFKESGNSFFSPDDKRISINVNDKKGFLKGLIAHEVNHGINYVHQYDTAISSMMLGDTTQGGLIRDVDGTLDPEFKAWGDKYNAIREENNLPPADTMTLANEYFTEIGTQSLIESIESGAVRAKARQSPITRSIQDAFQKVFSPEPLVSNLHFKTGGAIDGAGRMIDGTGLLAEGIKELPEVRAMVKKAINQTAGRKQAVAKPQPEPPPANKSVYKAKTIISDTNKKLNKEGKPLPEGFMQPDKSGNGQGMLTQDHLKELAAKGGIEDAQFAMALHLQDMMDDSQKFSVSLINKPIKQGRSPIDAKGEAAGLVVPTQWKLQNGALYLEAMDLNQLEKNLTKAIRNPIAKELGLTRKAIADDIQESIAIQNKGLSTDDYFKGKDPKKWLKRKNFTNAVLGQQTAAQLEINPLMGRVSPTTETGIIRTFAMHRLKSVIKMNDNVSIPFGQNSYYNIRENLMPQTPRIDHNGRLIPEVSISKAKEKPTPTRLAKDIALKNKIPLSKVTATGEGNTITPNDVRSYLSDKNSKFKPLYFRKEPKGLESKKLTDAVGSQIEYDGNRGILESQNDRPVLKSDTGDLIELPMTFADDASLNQLGVRIIEKRGIDAPSIISSAQNAERSALRDVFKEFNKTTDKVIGLASLAQSVVKGKGRNKGLVIDSPDFAAVARQVTDAEILKAWDAHEVALTKLSEKTNIPESMKQKLTQEIQDAISDIEALATAKDAIAAKKKIVSESSKESLKNTSPSQADFVEREIVTGKALDAINKAIAEAKRNKPVSSGSTPRRNSIQGAKTPEYNGDILKQIQSAITRAGLSGSRAQERAKER